MKLKNLPAISDPNAMRKFANVRNKERDALIDGVTLKEWQSILDIQSSSGYLSDEIYRRLNQKVTCFCLEPTKELRERLNPNFIAIDNPVENFYSVENETIDVVLGLAGLHHSESHEQSINESYRVLKPQGELGICDVLLGSSLDCWLNQFVNQNSTAGHKGNFVEEAVLKQQFIDAGFEQVHTDIKNVPWVFNAREEVLEFFKGLFSLNCDLQAIDAVLDDYFIIEPLSSRRVQVRWELLYCFGKKPNNTWLP